jgi:hypothetical protein
MGLEDEVGGVGPLMLGGSPPFSIIVRMIFATGFLSQVLLACETKMAVKLFGGPPISWLALLCWLDSSLISLHWST